MKDDILRELVKCLIEERNINLTIPTTYDDLFKIYKALVNTRIPNPIDEKILELEDKYLNLKLKDKNITDVKNLKEVDKNIIIWNGDISLINVDIIVNAGNHDGLGCFNPNHNCVDNVIHTNAGMRLRLECQNILNGKKIDNGNIIVCNGYNLPCKKIITTVGPQIIDKVTKQDEIDLANCYKNSLEYAITNNYNSIAFPSISTGLFGYPIKYAKNVALNSIKEVLNKYDTNIKIVFVLYDKDDYNEYQRMFEN